MGEKTKPSDSSSNSAGTRRIADTIGDPRMRSWAVSGLFLLALLATLYLARELVLPVVMALILNLVFAPFVRRLNALRIPEPIGAAVVVIGLIVSIAAGIYGLAEPASDWLAKAPQSIREIGAKLRDISEPVQSINTAGEQVTATTREIATGEDGKRKIQEVTVKPPTLARIVMEAAQKIALSTVSTLVLLYFLLASGDLYLRKAIIATRQLTDRPAAIGVLRQIESDVSTYLFTVTLINTGLGIAVAFAMYLMDVPNPVLWGCMVGLFNFIPYLGDIVSFSILTVVGLLSFDEPMRGLMVPLVYSILTATEGYVVAPLVVGRRLRLSPVVIVLAVLFWGWMWGILGAILAVPILVIVRTLCTHIESLRPFGEFLDA